MDDVCLPFKHDGCELYHEPWLFSCRARLFGTRAAITMLIDLTGTLLLCMLVSTHSAQDSCNTGQEMQSVLGSTVGNAPLSVTYGGHAAISDGAELTKAQVSAIAHTASLAATKGMQKLHEAASQQSSPLLRWNLDIMSK